MNENIYRVVWSLARRSWVVASEWARANGAARQPARRARARARQAVAAVVAGSLLAQPPLPVLARGAPTLAPAQAAESGSAWSRKLASEMQTMALRQAEREPGACVDSDYLKRQAQSQFNDVLQSGVDAARESGLPFLRNLQGGLNHDFQSGRTSVQLNTIDEVYHSGRNTGLVQLGAHNQNDRPTANVGAVYRREVNDALMVGVNGFLDYEFGKQHLRGSVGVEAIAPEFSLYGNVYAPISGWKGARRNDRREEKPASGMDVGVSYRPAFAPGLNLKASHFRWNGAHVDYFDNGRTQAGAKGFKVGVEYRPVPLVSVGLEQTKVIGGGRETRVQLGLSINLSEPLSKQLQRDTSGAPAFSLDARRHALVERENRIVLNTRRKEIILPLAVSQVSTHPIDGRVTVIGLTQPRATVVLRMPDGSSGSVTADAAGRYTYTSATDQPSGSIVLRASNAQGDQRRELTRPYVDEVVLGDMQVVVLAMAPQPADRALMLSGRTEPGMDVMVHFPNGESVAAKSDAEGLFHTRSLRAVGQGEVMVRAIRSPDPQGGARRGAVRAARRGRADDRQDDDRCGERSGDGARAGGAGQRAGAGLSRRQPPAHAHRGRWRLRTDFGGRPAFGASARLAGSGTRRGGSIGQPSLCGRHRQDAAGRAGPGQRRAGCRYRACHGHRQDGAGRDGRAGVSGRLA